MEVAFARGIGYRERRELEQAQTQVRDPVARPLLVLAADERRRGQDDRADRVEGDQERRGAEEGEGAAPDLEAAERRVAAREAVRHRVDAEHHPDVAPGVIVDIHAGTGLFAEGHRGCSLSSFAGAYGAARSAWQRATK